MSAVRHEVLAQEAREIAGRLLLGGEVVGVVGLRSDHGHFDLHLFTAADDLAALVLEPRYLLAPACRRILFGLPGAHPHDRAVRAATRGAQGDVQLRG